MKTRTCSVCNKAETQTVDKLTHPHKYTDKVVAPITHGGSGFSGTIRTIQSLEPNATVMEAGLSVSRNSVPDAAAAVKSWTDSLLAS